MKVLSDNTADRLLRHLDAAEGGITPRRIPRGAATTPPAPMWQLHVVPGTGVVTCDGGDIYDANGLRTFAAASVGTATATCYAVWTDGIGNGSMSLVSSLSGLAAYRVIGRIVKANNAYSVEQHVTGPIELGGGGGGGGGSDSDAVEVELDSSDSAYAHTDSWSYGDTATVPVDPEDPDSDTVEKKTYPKFTPFRLYWWEAQHKLLAFHRKVTTNPDGQIVAVSAENPDTNPANSPIEVFTAVSEMP